MLRLDHLSIQFAETICFSDARAVIERGDRIALIGDNGSGKTSLLRAILSGADGVLLAPGVRVGVLEQRIELEGTVWQASLGKLGQALARLEMFEGDAKEYEALVEYLEVCGGFDAEARAEALLHKFGLGDCWHREAMTLSGGERMRLGLVRMLLTDPDLLLLDEPTNHLDRAARTELMDFLDGWPGAALVVSHDEDLLQRWPRKIWHLQRGKLRSFQGDYTSYLDELSIEKEQQVAHYKELRRKKKGLGHCASQRSDS